MLQPLVLVQSNYFNGTSSAVLSRGSFNPKPNLVQKPSLVPITQQILELGNCVVHLTNTNKKMPTSLKSITCHSTFFPRGTTNMPRKPKSLCKKGL